MIKIGNKLKDSLEKMGVNECKVVDSQAETDLQEEEEKLDSSKNENDMTQQQLRIVREEIDTFVNPSTTMAQQQQQQQPSTEVVCCSIERKEEENAPQLRQQLVSVGGVNERLMELLDSSSSLNRREEILEVDQHPHHYLEHNHHLNEPEIEWAALAEVSVSAREFEDSGLQFKSSESISRLASPSSSPSFQSVTQPPQDCITTTSTNLVCIVEPKEELGQIRCSEQAHTCHRLRSNKLSPADDANCDVDSAPKSAFTSSTTSSSSLSSSSSSLSSSSSSPSSSQQQQAERHNTESFHCNQEQVVNNNNHNNHKQGQRSTLPCRSSGSTIKQKQQQQTNSLLSTASSNPLAMAGVAWTGSTQIFSSAASSSTSLFSIKSESTSSKNDDDVDVNIASDIEEDNNEGDDNHYDNDDEYLRCCRRISVITSSTWSMQNQHYSRQQQQQQQQQPVSLINRGALAVAFTTFALNSCVLLMMLAPLLSHAASLPVAQPPTFKHFQVIDSKPIGEQILEKAVEQAIAQQQYQSSQQHHHHSQHNYPSPPHHHNQVKQQLHRLPVPPTSGASMVSISSPAKTTAETSLDATNLAMRDELADSSSSSNQVSISKNKLARSPAATNEEEGNRRDSDADVVDDDEEDGVVDRVGEEDEVARLLAQDKTIVLVLTGPTSSSQPTSSSSLRRRLIKRSGISDQRLAEIQMMRALRKQLERAKAANLNSAGQDEGDSSPSSATS